MTYTKKIAAVLLAAAMTVPAVACSHASTPNGGDTTPQQSAADSNADPASTNAGDPAADVDVPPLQTDADGGFKQELMFMETPKSNNNGAEENMDNVIVTTVRGEDGNYYLPKTDINGAVVTQENGSAATAEAYTGTTLATTYAKQDYVPKYQSYQAFWLDTSKKADYIFDGEFLVLEAEIPADAVDGVYPIEFYYTDVSNYDAQDVGEITTVPGYICINSAEPAGTTPTAAGMTLAPQNVSAKPGDTVRIPIMITNNPGIVAFDLRLRYDSNAMQIVDAGAGKDFASSASMTAHEIGS